MAARDRTAIAARTSPPQRQALPVHAGSWPGQGQCPGQGRAEQDRVSHGRQGRQSRHAGGMAFGLMTCLCSTPMEITGFTNGQDALSKGL